MKIFLVDGECVFGIVSCFFELSRRFLFYCFIFRFDVYCHYGMRFSFFCRQSKNLNVQKNRMRISKHLEHEITS